MRLAKRWLVRVVVLSAAIGLLGCSPPVSWGGGGSSVSREENGVPVRYTIERLTRQGQPYAVLVANGCVGGSNGGGAGLRQGQLRTVDGRKIAWSSATLDARTGTMLIDGQRFDLGQGGLFLISTKDGPTKVEQLAADDELLRRCGDANTLPNVAKENERVGAFFKSCEEPK